MDSRRRARLAPPPSCAVAAPPARPRPPRARGLSPPIRRRRSCLLEDLGDGPLAAHLARDPARSPAPLRRRHQTSSPPSRPRRRRPRRPTGPAPPYDAVALTRLRPVPEWYLYAASGAPTPPASPPRSRPTCASAPRATPSTADSPHLARLPRREPALAARPRGRRARRPARLPGRRARATRPGTCTPCCRTRAATSPRARGGHARPPFAPAPRPSTARPSSPTTAALGGAQRSRASSASSPAWRARDGKPRYRRLHAAHVALPGAHLDPARARRPGRLVRPARAGRGPRA